MYPFLASKKNQRHGVEAKSVCLCPLIESQRQRDKRQDKRRGSWNSRKTKKREREKKKKLLTMLYYVRK
jgi:hypothetical protein